MGHPARRQADAERPGHDNRADRQYLAHLRAVHRESSRSFLSPSNGTSSAARNLPEVNAVFEAALRDAIADEAEIQRVIEHAASHGSIQSLTSLPEHLKDVFRTAHDISPEWHVRMQAAWQRHTDAAVSKTINLPADAPVADVDTAFRLAYELKCKGITVYRDGSRQHQPMALAVKPRMSPALRCSHQTAGSHPFGTSSPAHALRQYAPPYQRRSGIGP